MSRDLKVEPKPAIAEAFRDGSPEGHDRPGTVVEAGLGPSGVIAEMKAPSLTEVDVTLRPALNMEGRCGHVCSGGRHGSEQREQQRQKQEISAHADPGECCLAMIAQPEGGRQSESTKLTGGRTGKGFSAGGDRIIMNAFMKIAWAGLGKKC